MLKHFYERIKSTRVQDNKFYIGKRVHGEKIGKGKLFYPDHTLQYKGNFVKNMKQGQGVTYYPDGSSYKGEFKNNMRHGTGVMTYADKSTYKGEFKNDVREGQGMFDYNGNHYSGSFQNDQFDGSGTIKYANGDFYEGGFSQNEKQGQGVFHYSDGKQYTGEFHMGKPQGRGVLTFPSGDTLKGEFNQGQCLNGTLHYKNGNEYIGAVENNVPHGKGILYKNGDMTEGVFYKNRLKTAVRILYKDGTLYEEMANGDIYKGGSKNGVKNGQGRLTLRNGKVITGDFHNDKLIDGLAEILEPSGDSYKGNCKNGGVKHGRGQVSYRNGKTLTAEFENDVLLPGTSEISYPSGAKYQGDTINGIRNGKGTLFYPDGKKRYEGEYRSDKRHGRGVNYYSNDDIYTGNFEMDELDFGGQGEMFLEEELKNTHRQMRDTMSGSLPFTFKYGRNKSPPYIEPVCKVTDEILDNYFHIVKKLGSGGFGSVFLADVTPLGHTLLLNLPHQVAIKQMVLNDGQKHIFLNEINILKQNAIPQMLRYYGCYTRNNLLYLVMEYVNGVELFDLVQPGRLTRDQKTAVLKNIATAISDLHQANLIHRDIKLENIMVTPATLEIKLIDYGFTCKIEATASCSNRVGTLMYLDPRVKFGNFESMKKADWWAFGQVLYSTYSNTSLYNSQWMRVDPSFVRSIMPGRIADMFLKLYQLDQMSRPSGQEVLNAF
jgi:hypothetical protein